MVSVDDGTEYSITSPSMQDGQIGLLMVNGWSLKAIRVRMVRFTLLAAMARDLNRSLTTPIGMGFPLGVLSDSRPGRLYATLLPS